MPSWGKFLPDAGSILLDGEDITYEKDYKAARSLILRLLCHHEPRAERRRTCDRGKPRARLHAQINAPLFRGQQEDSAYFRELLATLDLGLEDRMKTKMGLLSGGQRQAAALLMATIARPKLLLLDEHTAALDPGTAQKVLQITKEIISDRGLTALMITHDMDQALRFGNRTIMMDSGKLLLDISGEERDAMTPEKLVDLFVRSAKQTLSDRTRLSI